MVTLVAAGLISLIGFMLAHWTERQLLTTDNYVSLVAPLPKDEEVAKALSDYTVNRLFERIDVEQKISEVLPPRAAFLAAPLTERVDARATQLTKALVQSDQFQGIWIAANRQAHQRLVNAARQETGPDQSDQRAAIGLRLENLLQSVKERLGSTSSELFSGTQSADQSVSLGIDLKTRFANFKKLVNTTDFLNSTLWLASLACLIGALALSRNRHRLLLILLAAVAVIALLQLIGMKALRPSVLNHVQEAAYRPAAGVIYDQLLATFQRSATAVFAVSTVLFGLLFIVRRPFISKNRTTRKWLRDLRSTGLWRAACEVRSFIGRYRWPIIGIGVFLVLIFMAFVPDFDWQGLVRALLVILIIIGLVNLTAGGPSAGQAIKKPAS
jgi:hypothetical protein